MLISIEIVTKIVLATYIAVWPRGAIKPLENTGIISDIVFEACSLLFGSFIHSGIVFRRGCGNHKING